MGATPMCRGVWVGILSSLIAACAPMVGTSMPGDIRESMAPRPGIDGIARKPVTGKEETTVLVARDGSRCVVTPERFEKTRIGDRVWCVWRTE